MWALIIFAEGAERGNPLARSEIVWGTIGLAVALLAGATVIYLVDKWRKRVAQTNEDELASLTSFRAMYENGEITETEYAELRRKLAERVKKPIAAAVGAPAAVQAPATTAPEQRVTPTPAVSPTPSSALPPPDSAAPPA